jgi:hypothetical protein
MTGTAVADERRARDQRNHSGLRHREREIAFSRPLIMGNALGGSGGARGWAMTGKA